MSAIREFDMPLVLRVRLKSAWELTNRFAGRASERSLLRKRATQCLGDVWGKSGKAMSFSPGPLDKFT